MTGSLAEGIPGAELHTIEGAGHLFWISHPNETYSAVVEFLDENETRVSKQVW
jgi:pimeloyl-ACP methyl ester carboxylesterase